MSYGSGTLVDVRDEYGLVVTNWHVVRDAAGPIQVSFPDGFQSPARALKVDQPWDLAALVIWRPNIDPVSIADHAPRPGDVLTIAGYGRGTYRVATGRCTQYVAPGVRFPYEMVELSVEARQGDSGGPIFNQKGELAGVLFGAGQGTTVGAFCGRVGGFLASLAPDIGEQNDIVASAAVDQKREEPRPRRGTLVAQLADNPPRRTPTLDAGRQPQRPSAAALPARQTSAGPADAWNDLAGHTSFERTKSVLAAIGGIALLLALSRLT